MYYLGVCLKNGFGCDKDNKRALKYFLLAADGGVTLAQYNIGAIYYLGDGCNVDYEKAFKRNCKVLTKGVKSSHAQGS